MEDKVTVIVPKGMFSASDNDDRLDKAMRDIAVNVSNNEEGEWADKYGTDFENGTFLMKKFCWCDQEGCKWCNGEEPNFRYKPLGFELKWYKYIGRDMEVNMELTNEQIDAMVVDCIKSAGVYNHEENKKTN